MLQGAYYLSGRITGELPDEEDRKTVLFPAGRYTHLLLQFNRPKSVYCICDNNIEKFGSTVEGVEVRSLDTLMAGDDAWHLVVTSGNLAPVLVRQLEDMGISERCTISVCNWGKLVPKNVYDPFMLEDRRKGHRTVLIVLAGYKEKLWDIVFKRIALFAPADMDVCIVSSGKYVDRLSEMCHDNGWTYLSTRTNNVSLIQNIAIILHPSAEYIYKLDEDIFICDGFFAGLMDAYKGAERSMRYCVDMVMPLIPVNPHGYVRFLEKSGHLEAFEHRFGRALYDFFTHFCTRHDETLFLWEHSLPLDETAKRFRDMPVSYHVCPHRASIGAILFKRTLWEEMGGFNVEAGNGIGEDERSFAVFMLTKARYGTYIMAENVLAGHYSFGMAGDLSALDVLYERNKHLFDTAEV